MSELISKVPDHEGPCAPTWINKNAVYHRIDRGVTGFFKNTKKVWWWFWPVKTGKEFHGIIRNNEVFTTKGVYK